MSKRHSSKYKIDRRLGENLWGRAKSPINRREYEKFSSILMPLIGSMKNSW